MYDTSEDCRSIDSDENDQCAYCSTSKCIELHHIVCEDNKINPLHKHHESRVTPIGELHPVGLDDVRLRLLTLARQGGRGGDAPRSFFFANNERRQICYNLWGIIYTYCLKLFSQ